MPTVKWHDMASTINIFKKWKCNWGDDEPSDSPQDNFAGEEADKSNTPDSDVNSNDTSDKDEEDHG